MTDNGITAINDNDLYVWIGTWKGLNLYNKKTCRITPFSDARLLDKVGCHNSRQGWECLDKRGWNDIPCDSTAHIIKEYEVGNLQEGYAISNIYADQQKSNFGQWDHGVYSDMSPKLILFSVIRHWVTDIPHILCIRIIP